MSVGFQTLQERVFVLIYPQTFQKVGAAGRGSIHVNYVNFCLSPPVSESPRSPHLHLRSSGCLPLQGDGAFECKAVLSRDEVYERYSYKVDVHGPVVVNELPVPRGTWASFGRGSPSSAKA